jgi:hypothetical protein
LNKKIHKNENKLINITIYLLAVLLLVILFIFIYLFTNYTFIKNEDFVNNYKKIEELKFEDLNQSIKKKYKLLIFTRKIESYISNDQNLSDKKIIKISKDKIRNPKIIKLKYNSMMCKNMNPKKANITNQCNKDYKIFINKNKNISYYEIIPLLAEDEFTKNEFKQDKIKRTLGEKRINLVKSKLKEIVKPNIKIETSKYYLISKKNYKGIVIRAYYK